ncbi:hypothetical protein [Clostridium weizhouense]|uniref:Alpha/beta hydrolase family protein n=1 Tax=Clostridium weizhouense TaxID=2859781 RepID=A0ABS7AT81_9CLOT|nr:hypothetical protein [Clostridium weizhouense]MBW6411887.1 hypothetical protein [Clostridium weizhouense]
MKKNIFNNIFFQLFIYLFIVINLIIQNNYTNINTTKINNIYNIKNCKNKTLSNVILKEFDFGDTTVKLENNYTQIYPLRGIIGVPENNQNHPIVFLLHGSHFLASKNNIRVNERYDLGLRYLVDNLAKQGYLTISVDVNGEYINSKDPSYKLSIDLFNKHLTNLTKAINGLDVGYGVNLNNKGDISNIVLIGHSLGCEGIQYITKNQKEKGKNIIKALLCLTPNYSSLINDISLADIPTAILITELDNNLDGKTLYNNMRKDITRNSWTILTYLKGAKTNYFNDNLDEKDLFLNVHYKTRKIIKKDYLTKKQQQDFLSKYSLDFLNSIYDKENISNEFKIHDNSLETLYGYEVLTSLTMPSTKYTFNSYTNNLSYSF